MDQRERLDKIAEFRDLQLRCLITTDIIARGLDIPSVNLVVSLDFPYETGTFLHRIGRAGRAMTDAMSVTFHKRQEGKKIEELREAFHLSFQPLDLANLPRMALPPLRTETQLANFARLRQVAAQRVERDDGVPLMFFCDMDDSYWATYRRVSAQFMPPFPETTTAPA
jgi:superfamily II DNA/RNA helicase